MTVVASASDGNAALDAITRERPDLALVDMAMPGQTGIDIARKARRVSPSTAVVLFTGYGEPAILAEAFDAGVRGIVLKDAPLDEVLRALRTVHEGGTYVDGRLAGTAATKRAPLTERELAVLRLLASGHRNEEIARQLFISPETVKAHLTKATRKLGATTRTQAVAEALRQGLIR